MRLTTGAGTQAEPVAVAAVTGLLALARRLPHWWAAQQRSEWAPLRGAEVPPDLRGQKALIVGSGFIGGNIAALVRHTRSLGDAAGLSTIGVHLVRLEQGGTSSVHHYHHRNLSDLQRPFHSCR